MDELLDGTNDVTDEPLQNDIHLILGIFNFRSAQLCAKNKLISTCKLSLNMALMYSEFAVVTSRENNLRERLLQAEMFHMSLKDLTKAYFDQLDVKALIALLS